MAPVTAVALAALLAAMFLVLVAAMLLQERPRSVRSKSEPHEYVLTDAAAWVWDQLPDPSHHTRDDVLRVLEWQVFFLQESVKGTPRGQAHVVVGDTPEAVAFILERAGLEGTARDEDFVRAVLELQGGYLASIGAVADAVETEEAHDARTMR